MKYMVLESLMLVYKNYGINYNFLLFSKDFYYIHEGCIYFIKYTVK